MKLYNLGMAAKAVNRSAAIVIKHMDRGSIPVRSVQVGRRWFWTEADIEIMQTFFHKLERQTTP
jgi:hypothetical protein